MREIHQAIGFEFDPRRHYYTIQQNKDLLKFVNRKRLYDAIVAGRIIAKSKYNHHQSKIIFDYLTCLHSKYLKFIPHLSSSYYSIILTRSIRNYRKSGGDIFIGVQKKGNGRYRTTKNSHIDIKRNIDRIICSINIETGTPVSYIIREFEIGCKIILNLHILPQKSYKS